jgi:PAS domain-containing protein
VKAIKKLICIMAVFVFICLPTAGVSAESTHKRVLYISSYAYDWDTVPMQLDGITDVLGGKAKLDYIFMNTKRIPDADAYDYTYNLAKTYIGEDGQYDAVLLGDDAALDFAIENQTTLFADTPLVFCGINSESKAQEAAKDPLMAGVVEKFPISETISLAQRFYPDAVNIVAISDDSESGKGSTAQFLSCHDEFLSLDFQVINTSFFTQEQLTEKISSYGSDTILLYLIHSRDSDGNIYSLQEGVEAVCAAANIPIFKSDEGGVGYGLIGGAVISYREMAATAATMVLDILNGSSPADMGVEQASVYYLFDENVLTQFGISAKDVPFGSELLNHQNSFFEQHPIAIAALGVACLIAGVIILFLTVSNINKRKFANQLRASRDSLAAAIDNSSMTYCEYDLEENRLYIGEKAQRVHDLPPVIENIPQGFFDTKCIQPQYYDVYAQLVDAIRAGQDEASAEIPLYTRTLGSFVWMRILFALIKSEDGTVVKAISTATDITEEKQAQRRYEQTVARRSFMDTETYASAHLNFTKNLVLEADGEYAEYKKDTVDEFFKACLENIEDSDENEELQKLFSRTELVSMFADGLAQSSAVYSARTENGERIWLHAYVKMIKNQAAADIEAYLYLLDVTDETIARRALEMGIADGVEVLAYLDLKTNIIKQLYTTRTDSIIPPQGMDYDELSEKSISRRVAKEDDERCRSYLKRSAILQHLALTDKYTFTVLYSNPAESAHKRFDIRYLDNMRDTVVFEVSGED